MRLALHPFYREAFLAGAPLSPGLAKVLDEGVEEAGGFWAGEWGLDDAFEEAVSRSVDVVLHHRPDVGGDLLQWLAQRTQMLANLLTWASRQPEPPPMAYQQAAHHLASEGHDLAPWLALLAVEDEFSDAEHAVAAFRAALESPAVTDTLRLRLFLAYPEVFRGHTAQRRASALREIGQAFFESDRVAPATVRLAEKIVRGEVRLPVSSDEVAELDRYAKRVRNPSHGSGPPPVDSPSPEIICCGGPKTSTTTGRTGRPWRVFGAGRATWPRS